MIVPLIFLVCAIHSTALSSVKSEAMNHLLKQKWLLQYINGECAEAYLPFPLKIKKRLQEKESAFVRLVDTCNTADEWQLEENFVLINLNYNLSVHPYKINSHNKTKISYFCFNRHSFNFFQVLIGAFLSAKGFKSKVFPHHLVRDCLRISSLILAKFKWIKKNFYSPWHHQKIVGFLMISGGVVNNA